MTSSNPKPITEAKDATGGRASRGATARPTKKTKLIKLLRSAKGADLKALSKKLGWQPHTTRAVISGLRKAGYTINLETPEDGKPARYRLTGAPQGTAG